MEIPEMRTDVDHGARGEPETPAKIEQLVDEVDADVFQVRASEFRRLQVVDRAPDPFQHPAHRRGGTVAGKFGP
jgi:hypothetical protein